MNRKELVEEIADMTGQSKSNVEGFVSSFIDVVSKNMKKKDGVRLVGFGTFSVAKRKARSGTQPSDGRGRSRIPARKAPVFKAGALFAQSGREVVVERASTCACPHLVLA